MRGRPALHAVQCLSGRNADLAGKPDERGLVGNIRLLGEECREETPRQPLGEIGPLPPGRVVEPGRQMRRQRQFGRMHIRHAEEGRRALHVVDEVGALGGRIHGRHDAVRLEHRPHQDRPRFDRQPELRCDRLDVRQREVGVGRGEIEIEAERAGHRQNLKTPYPGSPNGAFSEAEMAMPSALRVSTGSMMPSSQSSEVE